jgi:hypothetical protein
MTEHTGASYDSIASKYAQTVDTKPWNAHYERPAVVSLLPPLANAAVLDVGCGSGWYADYRPRRERLKSPGELPKRRLKALMK